MAWKGPGNVDFGSVHPSSPMQAEVSLGGGKRWSGGQKGPPPSRSLARLLNLPTYPPLPSPSCSDGPSAEAKQAGGGRCWGGRKAWCNAPAGRRYGKLLLEESCSNGPLGLRVQGLVFPLPLQMEKGLQQPRPEQWSCWLPGTTRTRGPGGQPLPSECNAFESLLLGNWALGPGTFMLPHVPPFSAEP